MSRNTTYLGFYIKIYNPAKPIDHQILTCSNIDCVKYEEGNAYDCYRGNFCSRCGSPIKDRTIQRVAQPKFDDYKEFKDRMIQAFTEHKPENLKDYNFFIPNQDGFGKLLETYETFELPIRSEDIRNDIFAFIRAFKHEIDRLIEVFGDNNVRTGYGILNY